MSDVTTKNLLSEQLLSLYSMETLLVEAMPEMIGQATNFGLKKNLALHFEETRQHKVAIAAICKVMDIEKSESMPNPGMEDILKQRNRLNVNESSVEGDLAIIRTAREIEEYEMNAYDLAANLARELGYEGVSKRLFLSMEEERQANTKLIFLENVIAGTDAKLELAPV